MARLQNLTEQDIEDAKEIILICKDLNDLSILQGKTYLSALRDRQALEDRKKPA